MNISFTIAIIITAVIITWEAIILKFILIVLLQYKLSSRLPLHFLKSLNNVRTFILLK